MKAKLWLVCALGALAGPAQADVGDVNGAGDWSADAFAFFGTTDETGNTAAWGLGAGVNYFVTRHLGAGIDTYMDAFESPYQVNASAIARLPLADTPITPFALAGVGRQFEHISQWQAHLGAGAEVPLKGFANLFGELRGVFPDRTEDHIVVRIGLRFRFH